MTTKPSGAGCGWVLAAIFGLMLLGRCGEKADPATNYSGEAPAAPATLYDPAPAAPPADLYVAPYVAPEPVYSAPTYYRNCSAARAAGAAPVYAGEPGYVPHLDRDGDGIGCE